MKNALVLATRNPGKIREFRRLLRELAPDLSWSLVGADDAGLLDVQESGLTFADNARIKAVSAARQCDLPCLGEDSGLEVDYLDGAPGVMSHRFSPSGEDHENNLLLLKKLENVPWEKRTARYRSAIVVADSQGVVALAEGTVEGYITEALLGTNGFGYDPLFFVSSLGKTLGQATDGEKDAISHRRRALEAVLKDGLYAYWSSFGHSR
ncbi:MAG: RdgB/HAM1 family non-canonical purine NTP pyrophosphatase [Bacillota bacterium]|jgi:XTP/dITP diphosphohydrolase